MALISSSGFNHIRLTVTDIARSKAFYDQVFGFPIALDVSGKATEPGIRDSKWDFYGGTVYQTPQGTLFGLRPVARAEFDSEHAGLDHLSFTVASRAELDAAVTALDGAGVRHGEVVELTDFGIAILSFQDPDDINIELTSPLT